jgi:t-SNARE complex subunit (syntaxin)
MEQLHQMCLDLAALVSDQGDMVDSIEAHVQHSVAYVERGRHHVKQARRLQRGIRTRMLLSTFALAAVITLVVVAVAIPTAIHFG